MCTLTYCQEECTVGKIIKKPPTKPCEITPNLNVIGLSLRTCFTGPYGLVALFTH
eukprot:m.356471 g.356471  ORF g.356471 m.356471 type:complete len:55 (-) comp16605_c0_seq14:172-336(-)